MRSFFDAREDAVEAVEGCVEMLQRGQITEPHMIGRAEVIAARPSRPAPLEASAPRAIAIG
jgi:hypothetical protein